MGDRRARGTPRAHRVAARRAPPPRPARPRAAPASTDRGRDSRPRHPEREDRPGGGEPRPRRRAFPACAHGPPARDDERRQRRRQRGPRGRDARRARPRRRATRQTPPPWTRRPRPRRAPGESRQNDGREEQSAPSLEDAAGRATGRRVRRDSRAPAGAGAPPPEGRAKSRSRAAVAHDPREIREHAAAAAERAERLDGGGASSSSTSRSRRLGAEESREVGAMARRGRGPCPSPPRRPRGRAGRR